MSARSNTFRWAVISLLLVITCNRAFAGKTLYVDDDGPADFNNIQAAIDDANDGDSIIVQPGLYKEFVEFHGKNITLTSTSPAKFNVVAATIIDYGAGFVGTEEPNCTLTGFKINGWISGNHTHAMISYCLLQGNRVPRGTVIRACDGTISNCVVTDNSPPSDVIASAVSECHGLIKNCTIAHNTLGVHIMEGGTTTIENCIIYHNSSGQVGVGKGATVNIKYSDVQGGLEAIYLDEERTVNWGPGNVDTDPCFVRVGDWFGELKGDYHLKSQAGRWNLMSETWVQDDVTSPCIDAGAPMSVIGHEPFPNGGRVNIGAYGGTPEASKSYFGEPVCETIVAGDINGDCKVNFLDFAIMALHWLECTAPECEIKVTGIKIIKGELVEGRFQEIDEVDKLIVGDVFRIRIEVSNLGSETVHVFNLYGWDLSPQNYVEVIGTSVPCAAIYDLEPGESAFLGPFCLSQAFKAKKEGWVTMNIRVNDWYSSRLCERTFTFEVLSVE